MLLVNKVGFSLLLLIVALSSRASHTSCELVMILLLLPLNEWRNLCYHISWGTYSSGNTTWNLSGGSGLTLAASLRNKPMRVLRSAHDGHALVFTDWRLLELTGQRYTLRFLLLFAVSSLDSTEVWSDALVSHQVLLGNVTKLTMVRVGSKLTMIELLL